MIRNHLSVDGAGLSMRAGITPDQVSDYTGYDLVMADNLPQPLFQLRAGAITPIKFGKASEENKSRTPRP